MKPCKRAGVHVPFPVGELQWGYQVAESTAAQLVQCVARASWRSWLWWKWMFHPAVSPSPLLTCIRLSPVASHLSSLQLLLLPSAWVSQELEGSVMSAGVSVPSSSSVQPPSKAASTCSGTARGSLHSPGGEKQEGVSVYHTHKLKLVTHQQHFTLSHRLLFAGEKKSRKNRSLKGPPSAPLLSLLSYAQQKLLKDTRWIKETGNHSIRQKQP